MTKKLLPTNIDEISTSILTSVDDSSELTIPIRSGLNEKMKAILSIDGSYSDEKIMLSYPLITINELYNKMYAVKIVPDVNRSVEISSVYKSWDKDRYIENELVSDYLSSYVKQIEFKRQSAQRYNFIMTMNLPHFGKKNTGWYNDYILETKINSIDELPTVLQFEDRAVDYHNVPKKIIEKVYNIAVKHNIKVKIEKGQTIEEFLTTKKHSNIKLMDLKINSRTILYDPFQKKFITRPKNEDSDQSTFYDDDCKKVVNRAKVYIDFDSSDRYSDDSGFSYTLILISNDSKEKDDDPHRWGYSNGMDGVTVFHCVEDENIFDIIKKFRELNIPTSLSGIKKLLNIYERTEKLVNIVNERFEEDVLLAQIGEDGISL